MQNCKIVLMAFAAAGMLAACGGGGGPINSAPPTETAEDQYVRALDLLSRTDSSPPTETAEDQVARVPGLISRIDSFVISAVHGETSSPDLPTFRFRASCSGTACALTEPTTGLSTTIRLSDLELVSISNAQIVGTKSGITLFRGTGRYGAGRYGEIDYRALGAWMEHSGFSAQMEGGTFEGIRLDIRLGLAGGDLTGTRPSGSATWQGFMVGTPVTGAGRGDRLYGNAALTYDMRYRSLDAAFTDIRNIDRLRAHTTAAVRFNSIPVDIRGKFQAGLTGNRIQGGFYGPGHAEAAGVFEQANIVGAFGAKR